MRSQEHPDLAVAMSALRRVSSKQGVDASSECARFLHTPQEGGGGIRGSNAAVRRSSSSSGSRQVVVMLVVAVVGSSSS